MFELMVERHFSAAHVLVGYEDICADLHGHNFKVQVFVAGSQLNEIGIIIDFKELRQLTDDILSTLDHKYLNDLPAFENQNPTSENIAKYIFEQLKEAFTNLNKNVKVKKVTVYETPQAGATYSEE